VVIVIRHGKTSRAQLANAAATMENVDARVVGSVLNMKRTNKAERRRYGHHGYYFGPGAVDGSALKPPANGTPAISWDPSANGHAAEPADETVVTAARGGNSTP
jgi:Mrp family chromosome partitioning ATPase